MKQSDVDRFWQKVDRSGECWLWTGGTQGWGYGRFSMGNKIILAHRFSYILSHGEIPDNTYVCHHCDAPRCVRPEHLFLGTHADNVRDRNRKGRQATGEANGQSRLTAAEVRSIREQVASGTPKIEVARRFGVDRVTVYRIVRRLFWRDD